MVVDTSIHKKEVLAEKKKALYQFPEQNVPKRRTPRQTREYLSSNN
jgi:hypothetical protein